MKALHSVREDKSQLFERKVRRETTACIAQLNTKKQKVTHSRKKKPTKKSSFCVFDYFW